MVDSRLAGKQVRIVGVGLLGTSIGLGLNGRGVDVVLADASPTNLDLAVDYGAGRAPRSDGDPERPDLVVVCVPPDVTADVVAAELAAHPGALVTDVASVKSGILASLRDRGADTSRYIGTHPMAGRERGGPLAGRADLFLGRPWVVAAHDDVSYERGSLIDDLILDLGATLIELSPEEHDRAVGLVSHAPQLVASLLAARLVDADDWALRLTGQGLRDTTRIAASDPALWVQILGANAPSVAAILGAVRADLDAVIAALEDPEAAGARRTIARAMTAGNEGVARLPGKHGVQPRFTTLVVVVDDRPGQLARLLGEIGQMGVNLEDLRIEHSPGAAVGFAEVAVLPAAAERTLEGLTERGWKVAPQ